MRPAPGEARAAPGRDGRRHAGVPPAARRTVAAGAGGRFRAVAHGEQREHCSRASSEPFRKTGRAAMTTSPHFARVAISRGRRRSGVAVRYFLFFPSGVEEDVSHGHFFLPYRTDRCQYSNDAVLLPPLPLRPHGAGHPPAVPSPEAPTSTPPPGGSRPSSSSSP